VYVILAQRLEKKMDLHIITLFQMIYPIIIPVYIYYKILFALLKIKNKNYKKYTLI